MIVEGLWGGRRGEAMAEVETVRERDWRVECAAVCEKKYRSTHWRGSGRSVGVEPEARLTKRRKATEEWRMELEPKRESVALRWEREHETVEKKSEMETWLVMGLVRILELEREPRWLTLQRTEKVRARVKSVAG